MNYKLPTWLVLSSYLLAAGAGFGICYLTWVRVGDADVEELAAANETLRQSIVATDSLLDAKQDTIDALALEADSLRGQADDVRVVRVETEREQRESWMSLAEYLSAQADTAALALLDEHLRLDDRVTHEYEGELSVLRQLAENQARQVRLLTEVADTLRVQRDSLLVMNSRLVEQNRQLVRRLNPPFLARFALSGAKCGLTGGVVGLAQEDAGLGALTASTCYLVDELGGRVVGLVPGL